jgi:DnaK suppressor protein
MVLQDSRRRDLRRDCRKSLMDREKAQEPMAKKKYTKRELEPFKRLLLQHRNVVTGNLTSLDGEGRGSSGDEGDLSSENFEIELTLSTMQSQTKRVNEIDEALKRIDEGSYGVCEDTGDLIPIPRLEAVPWTRLSVAAQERRDQS